MPDLEHDDIVQQFNNSVIFYKGKPNKVARIGFDNVVLLDLYSQRKKEVEFKLKDFVAPPVRLGMVNLDGACVYVKRSIRKQFATGLTTGNTTFHMVPSLTSSSRREIMAKVNEMACPEFADMLMGHYPTIQSAFNQAQKLGGAVAFDKQFCVDVGSQVFYKESLVGSYNTVTDEIVFTDAHKHLSILLKGSYAKAPRTFR
jgi:hypothetical protein